MAARSMASLTISFGMVAIPVDLYTAVLSSEKISFNLLHAKDGSRLKQQYVCVKEGTVVDRSEIVKGYEFAKDQYVQFTAEEIKALDEAGSDEHRHRRVRAAGVGRPAVLRSQLLPGARQGWRPPVRAAGSGSARDAALRHRPLGLARPRPYDRAATARQGDRHAPAALCRRSASGRGHRLGADRSEGQRTQTCAPIDRAAEDRTRFDPRLYVDEVKARIEAAIQKKIEGKQVSLSVGPTRTPAGNVIDLTAALKASLGGGRQEKLGPRKGTKRVERKAPARKTSRA